MTVIAANREYMAADSKCTVGDLTIQTPKLVRKGLAIIGTAGDSGACNKFIRWYGSKRKPPELDKDTAMQALVLTPKGLFYYSCDCEPVEIGDQMFAIGSGEISAMTAMKRYKADPSEAVEAACDVVEGCGLPVQVMHLNEQETGA